MNTVDLCNLFKSTTTLKSGQIKTLVDIVLQYDEPEDLAYEAIGLLNSGKSYSQIKKDYISEQFGWNGVAYKKYIDARNSNDSILANPPEVREGEIECPKCHKTKTLVVEMQTRSADEGFTYAIHCFNPECSKFKR